MSISEGRRPRRIIQAPLPPPQHSSPLPRAVERFQRALLVERRLYAPRVVGAATQPLPATASTPVPARADGQRSVISLTTSEAAASEPGLSVAVQAPGFALPLISRSPQPQSADPGASIEAELTDADEWAQQLVNAIVTLCERTAPAIEAWSVTLPMEPRMFPATELHISLSRHRVALRFQTQSSEAMGILSRHRASLSGWLRRSLSGDRDIDIEIT